MNGVDLTKDGQEVDTSATEALTTVKVSVHVPGEATLPPRLLIGLRSGTRVPASWMAIDPKGEAELQQIAAARYEVLVRDSGKPYSIAHISAEAGGKRFRRGHGGPRAGISGDQPRSLSSRPKRSGRKLQSARRNSWLLYRAGNRERMGFGLVTARCDCGLLEAWAED